MKLTYDKDADAAYIYLKHPVKHGEAARTVTMKENIILDFDKSNKLIGVEILNASKMLDKSVLVKEK
jgi:uncharacterized protein YuzE